MPSRRKIKKSIKAQTNLLIEDAFIESINGDDKEGKKMDALIDSIIDDRHNMLNKVSAYPKGESRVKVKEHFKGIQNDLESKTKDYDKKIGRVG